MFQQLEGLPGELWVKYFHSMMAVAADLSLQFEPGSDSKPTTQLATEHPIERLRS